ncbi:MAG TPA: phospholipase D-like domain-containing protein, partial [Kofleriaceae bacterium]|nr:phospholipase D-like domain-containing protein [Kofleriaceae bacterium]
MRARPQRTWLPRAVEVVTDDDLAYAVDPEALCAGNRVRLLIDGEQAFPAMLEAIAAAQTFVHLETYIFEHDLIGIRFGEALSERARAGVKVRVIVDAIGGMSLPGSFIAALRADGVEILIYRPLIARKTFGRWTRRDHRKLLVTDGTAAFIGGINIGDEYAATGDGGRGWRDTHVRVEGPVVGQIEALFSDTWHGEGGAPYRAYPREADESVAVPGSVFAAALGSDDRGNRTAIRRAYLHAIARARQYIYIANAYFVPDRGIRR